MAELQRLGHGLFHIQEKIFYYKAESNRIMLNNYFAKKEPSIEALVRWIADLGGISCVTAIGREVPPSGASARLTRGS